MRPSKVYPLIAKVVVLNAVKTPSYVESLILVKGDCSSKLWTGGNCTSASSCARSKGDGASSSSSCVCT